MANYNPNPIKRKEIPKPDKPGETRKLGIPNMIDRVIQECVKLTIEPILEAQFFEHSYGFRPMRDARMAKKRVEFLSHSTGYHWIIEGDISKFFDEVDHTILIKKLWGMGIHDRRILMVIKAMLKTGILHECKINELGTTQGGIISPILANVYLHSFDKWITREWENKKTKHSYSNPGKTRRALLQQGFKPAYLVRYADDWVIITNSKENAMKIKWKISKFLKDNLRLELSDKKTNTKRLIEAGKILGIEVMDHIIIGNGNFLSLKAKGFI